MGHEAHKLFELVQSRLLVGYDKKQVIDIVSFLKTVCSILILDSSSSSLVFSPKAGFGRNQSPVR